MPAQNYLRSSVRFFIYLIKSAGHLTLKGAGHTRVIRDSSPRISQQIYPEGYHWHGRSRAGGLRPAGDTLGYKL